jgi:hypothetical protein
VRSQRGQLREGLATRLPGYVFYGRRGAAISSASDEIKKLARACGPDQLLLCGAAGNRTRHKNRVELRKYRINYAKVRETACGYARRVDGINTHNAPVVRWSGFPSESIAGRTIDGARRQIGRVDPPLIQAGQRSTSTALVGTGQDTVKLAA